jgi:hypothetical protein
LLNYGSHDNANLLLSYGFSIGDNPADTFRTSLDMDTLLVRQGSLRRKGEWGGGQLRGEGGVKSPCSPSL